MTAEKPKYFAENPETGTKFQIDIRPVNGAVVLDCRGKITLGVGDEVLKRAVADVLASGLRNVVLNCQNVPYMDSAGLGELVRSYAKTSRSQGRLGLLNPSKRIRDQLAITKLRTVFDVFESEAEVVASFTATPAAPAATL